MQSIRDIFCLRSVIATCMIEKKSHNSYPHTDIYNIIFVMNLGFRLGKQYTPWFTDALKHHGHAMNVTGEPIVEEHSKCSWQENKKIYG